MAKLRSPILWILILAAIARFVQIDSPPLGRHSWRQSDTAGVARNYHRFDHGFLFPQVDWEIPGFVEMELPIYPWTASLIYEVTGESEAVARTLSVLGSLLTIGLLYLIVVRVLGRRSAAWAALFYAILPLSLFFGRAIMPESWMLAATAGSIYCFLRWLEDNSWGFFVLAGVATALACLLKLTSLYIGLTLLWLAWQRWGRRTMLQWQMWLFGALVLGSLAAWYGHAYQLGQEFGASFHILTAAGSDKWGNWGLLIEPDFYHQVFVGNLGGRMLTWVGLPVFVLGLFLPRRTQLERLFDVWLLAVVIVILLASGGSYQHDYYSLPILLPAVVFMGKIFDRGWERNRNLLVLAALAIAVLGGYRHFGTLAEERVDNHDTVVARTLAAETSAGDLVISCNAADPTWLYLADRRGWGRDCSILGKSELETLRTEGASLLIGRDPVESELAASDVLDTYLETFHDVRIESNGTVIARLTGPREFSHLEWETAARESFDNAPLDEHWRLGGGDWHLEGGALVGVANGKTARAVLEEPMIACEVCRLQVGLTLLPLSTESTSSRRPARRKQRARQAPKASVRIWQGESRSGLVITLNSRDDSVRLQQFEDGESLGSRLIEYPIEVSRVHRLELRVDPFEFELLLDGESRIVQSSRLSTALQGTVQIQAQSGGIAVYELELEARAGNRF